MSDDRFKDARRSLMDDEDGDDEQEVEDEAAEAKTALVDLDKLQAEKSKRDAQKDPSDDTPARNQPDREVGGGNQAAPEPESRQGQQKDSIQIGGDDAGDGPTEGKTDYIDTAKFADEGESLAPDEESAGYSGNTQFVDVNELAEGQPDGSSAIIDDETLQASYEFSEEDVYEGDVTVVFAKNFAEESVVLRRIWDEQPASMPQDVRERIKQLKQLEHPNLVPMKGMLGSETGTWAEFPEPKGYRLTAILEEYGTQAVEDVRDWLRQIADALQFVHEHDFVYANLNTDAIWIQQDNSVEIEPFDILRFSHRGDLGEFGPPEMTGGDEDVNLHPDADVYSLGKVGIKCLTGDTVAMAADTIEDDAVADVLKKAASDAPEQRFATVAAFTEALDGAESGGLDIDFGSKKLIAGAAGVVLLVGAGFVGLKFIGGSGGEKMAKAASSGAVDPGKNKGGAKNTNAPAKTDEPDKDKKRAKKKGASKSAGSKAPEPESIEPKAAKVKAMPIEISRSYAKNPPKGRGKPQGADSKESAKLRKEMNSYLEKAKKASDRDKKLKHFRNSLKAVTKVIRRKDKPSKKEAALFQEITSHELVRSYLDGLRRDVEKALENGEFGTARRKYQTWAQYDYRAGAQQFFSKDRAPTIKELKVSHVE